MSTIVLFVCAFLGFLILFCVVVRLYPTRRHSVLYDNLRGILTVCHYGNIVANLYII